jgi:hypothetical protein
MGCEVANCIPKDTTEPTEPLVFNIVPNPNSGSFTVNLPQHNGGQLRLLNTQGQILQHFVVDALNNKQEFVTDLPMGIYFVEWMSNKDRLVKKVLIR